MARDAWMTGNIVLREPRSDVRFLRAVIRLEGGTTLLFTDARRFGTAVVLEDAEVEAHMDARAGVEPLSERLTAEGSASWRPGGERR